ncbi:MAG: LamG domain-containing protein [Myxococcales bacterium]|nr:LamG domain-containing protein [Myxococcales bacterium]
MALRRAPPAIVPLATALVVGGALAGGCREPTQITVVLSTDVDCPRVVETTLGVGTLSNVNDKPPASGRKGCKTASGRIGSLVVVPSGDDHAEVALLAVMTVDQAQVSTCDPLTPGPKCVVARRALRYVPHTPLTLPIELSTSCLGVKCQPDETCFKGLCVSAKIPDPEQCTDPAACVPKLPSVDGGADASADAADAAGDADAGADAGATDPDLVLHFDFDAGALMDRSGYGNLAMPTNVKFLGGAGRNGSGEMVFNGTNASQVIVQPSAALATVQSATGMTFAVWVKPTGNAGATGGYLLHLDNDPDLYFRLAPSSVLPTATVGINGVNWTSLPMGAYTHLAITYQKGAAVTLYVNGAPKDTSGTANPANFTFNGSVIIGDGFVGALDELRLYRKVLPASAIAALAQ